MRIVLQVPCQTAAGHQEQPLTRMPVNQKLPYSRRYTGQPSIMRSQVYREYFSPYLADWSRHQSSGGLVVNKQPADTLQKAVLPIE
ncbi:hypothetical protein BDZ91DRAFT_751930 [Kalaharituber pfeilii]|nr:hypothetical protein BDZ91DRAFT_751930 [Kalaharituber pfeilii]